MQACTKTVALQSPPAILWRLRRALNSGGVTKIAVCERLLFTLENPQEMSFTVRLKSQKECLDASEMKGLGKILRVSWTAEKIIEWVLNHAGVKRELLDTV